MERWQHLEPTDCAEVTSHLWRDECVFLLAERQWKGGQQVEGLATCRQTRFARACTWHLIQDEAEAALMESPEVAEARLSAFAASGVAPDAPIQFWKLWLRGRSGAGLPIDERSCAALQNAHPCQEAVGRYIHELLEANARQDRTHVCTAAPGERVRTAQGPVWLPGPLTETVEQQWVSRYCPSP